MRRHLLASLLTALLALAASGCTKECPDCTCTPAAPQECPACTCEAPQIPECPDLTCPAGPQLLGSYAEIREALENGRNLRVVFHYGRCILDGGGWGPNAIGGMPVDVFEWFDRGVVYNEQAYLSLSSAKLIRLGQNFRYNYAKVRIYEDDRVEVVAEYVDPTSFASTMQETFECELTQALNSPQAAFVWAD